MKTLIFPAAFVLLVCLAAPAAAQTSLQLRWELKGDVFTDAKDRGASHVLLTLTNKDTKPLPAAGWAIYFNCLFSHIQGSEKGGITMDSPFGGLYRIRPTAAFAGLAPGGSVTFEYATRLIGNISQRPAGPYIVFDANPAKGYAIAEYQAMPFERPDQQGRDPRVVTPAALYDKYALVENLAPDAVPPILPTPLRMERRDGVLTLLGAPAVTAAPSLATEAGLATAYLASRFSGAASKAATVKLEVGTVAGQASPEAYDLTVDATGVRIVGNSAAGVFWGVQSLRSLLPPSGAAGGPLTVPFVHVVDAPRFGYRGLHIDVSRNFQPKSTVLKVIDLMARYKLNVLHFHLIDDEGWRLEIAGLPELTQVGARRGHTLDSANFLPPTYGSGPDVDRPYGSGYFTRADYIEILKYADARHIEVMPEFEMPGHGRAAIKAMEARARRLTAAGDAAGAKQYLLSDANDTSVYNSPQDYHDNVINPAMDSTYAFIEKVVDEIAALHKEAGVPLRNLHLGGDEVPNGVWEKSPVALAYLKAHGLTTVDELWYVFFGRVEQILKKHNLVPSGWEEMGTRKTRLDGRAKLIPNPMFGGRGWRTFVWNNVPGWGAEDLAYRLANAGYQVVLSPVSNTYLDMAYSMNPEEIGLFWGGFADIDKPFDFIPLDYYRNQKEDARGNPLPASLFVGKDRLTDYGRDNVIGIEACLWSEASNADGLFEYLLMPKVLGFVERAWAADPDWVRETDAAKSGALYRAAWSRFVNAVGKRELPRLDQEGLSFALRVPKPGLKVVDGTVRANAQFAGLTLRYTTDGSEPTPKSPVLAGPIPAKGTIRVAAFDARGRKSASSVVRVP